MLSVSSNASKTKPAKLLAAFVVDERDETDDPVRVLEQIPVDFTHSLHA